MQLRWTILLLLFFMQIVNSLDKAVMGLAAVPIMRELHLTPQQYGIIASSFYSLYALSTLVVALLFANRVPPRIILIVLLAAWSTVQLPILFAASFAVLVVCRTALGVAEGPGTPTIINATHEWFAPEDRSLPTALVMFGTTVGPLLGAPILSYLIVAYGWRAAFAACAVLSFAALALWFRFGADGPGATVRPAEARPKSSGPPARWTKVWADRTIVGSLIGGFCAYWGVGFGIAWLAPLLTTGLGYDGITTGWLIALIFAGQGVIGLVLSGLSHAMTKRGAPSRQARGLFIATMQLASAAAFVAAALMTAPPVKVGLILLAASLPGVTFTLGPSILSEVLPPARRNRDIGIILATVSVAGAISPYVSGLFINAHPGAAGYNHALLLVAAILAIGGAVSFATLHPETSQRALAGA
ncbi:MFS transporter [Sphingobium amiense]|uniref:MFS transporter n=1 Tax=Sphingobium amiense TaxID=135719 RepID=A0A494W5M7_9SPHN|nr:MFS transporter [Sphingobium amiense]BBD99874.1 MFS transporter [Sphingobium amiense]